MSNHLAELSDKIENAFAKKMLEEAIKEAEKKGLVELSESGELIDVISTIEELKTYIFEFTAELLEKSQEAIAFFTNPRTIIILAESLTAADLKKAGVDEELIELFKEAKTTEKKEEILNLVEPGKLIPLFIKKRAALKKAYSEQREKTREEGRAKSEREKERIKSKLLSQLAESSDEANPATAKLSLLRPALELKTFKEEETETD